MKSRELQTLWWDWLGTSERLLRSLHEQSAAVTLRDPARVQRIQPEIDTLFEKVQSIDESATVCAKVLAEEIGAEPNLRSLAGALEKAEGQQLQGLANRVTVAARNLEAVFRKNRAQIATETVCVDGVLTIIARANDIPNRRQSRGGAAVLVEQAA